MEADRGPDALAWFLTSNSTSLGGARSTVRARGLAALVLTKVPALRIDNVHPACGEGDAVLKVTGEDTVSFTPPDGDEGDEVTIPEGQSKVVAGLDANKAIRVYREAGLPLSLLGAMNLKLVMAMNGVIAQSNLTSAQRAAGRTTYRAVMLHAPADEVRNIKLWLPPVVGAQATYSIGTEVAVSHAIQTITDEATAPTGIVWASPTTEGAALSITKLAAGASLGLWIRRVFPPGNVAAVETVQLACKFEGA